MNHQEALKILDLQGTPSEKEIDAAFKKKAKAYHPDVCKDADATDKFKLANQAKEVLKNPPIETQQVPGGWGSGFGNIEDLFRHVHGSGFGFNDFSHQSSLITNPNIHIPVTIDFKSSVLGCKQNIQYKRFQACISCQGLGKTRTSIACTGCGGKGKIGQKFQRGNSVYINESICRECSGQKVLMEDCKACAGTATTEQEMNLSVQIPSGISSGMILNLDGAGHWSPGEHTTKSVLLNITVTPHPTMWLVGNDVHQRLTMSLLEALEGSVRVIEGVNGNESIRVPPLSKGGDHINIPMGGVKGKGQHVVIVDIDYGDAGKLIEFLKSKPIEPAVKETTPSTTNQPKIITQTPTGKKLSRKQRKKQRK